MRIRSREILLASASVLALSATPAMAQLVTFGSGSVSAPNTTTGVSIGLLASQINSNLTGSAVVNNGTGITTAPSGTSAADATTSVTTNTISATMAGNVAGPATGQLYTVDVAGISSDGTGSAATTAYQLNTAPNVLAGVGVDSTGAVTGGAQTVGSNFATQLTSSAAVTGNTIGSTAVGNQAANVAGGATPGAGTAGASAEIGVIGALQQRTNTVDFTNLQTGTGDFTLSTGLTAPTSPGPVQNASGDWFYYVSATEWYYGGALGAPNTTAAVQTTGTYGTVADPGGSVSGVIAATTLQRNTDIASTGGIRAITDGAAISAQLQAGAASATLDNSLNAVSSAATGNTATTGIAITGGAPTLNGGLAVLNEQVNATSGSAAAGISATTSGSSVSTSLGATAGTSLASSSTLMEGNRLTAAATGSTATNTLTVDGLVRLEAAASPTTGNGTGSVSTGALLSQERTVYTESVSTSGSTLETSGYTTVAADSSGVAPYQAASAVADYLSVNIQRNTGTATAPLAVTGTVSGGGITLGTDSATTGTTATSSTVGLTGNSVTADATGARANTSIGSGTATLLGDGATLAALSLQESSSTSTRASVSGSGVGVTLGSDAVGTATQGGVLSGSTVTVGSNTVSATGVSNVASTSLNNIAAAGGTLSTGATFTSAIRSDTTGDNVDTSYAAPLAAISSQSLTSAVASGTDATIASANVANTDVTLRLVQDAATGTPTAATGSTIGLTGNRTLATAGGNQATVGVSFAEGSGSLLPGGAVAGNSQILAPTVSGTGITASISDSSMQVSATGVGGVGAAGFVGGSVTASGNRIASQAIGNQGAGSISASSLLIAGGDGGTGAAGAAATLTNGSATSDTAAASYLLANTQRAAPSTAGDTMAIASTVADGSVSVIGGGSASTVGVDGNVVSAVGAANVFSGAMTGLSSTGQATQLAVSQQDVAGVSVTSGLTNAAAVFSIGNGSLSGIDSTTTAQAFTGGSASVSDNTFRALSVMNESGLSVTGAGVADLGTTGGGRIATASLTGSAVSLSGIEAGAASQQALSLDNTGTTANAGAYGVSSTSGARVGINGGLTSVGFENTTLDVTGNTVDARTLGNTAVVSTSGSVFAGGVGVVNSQSVSQNAGNTLAGLAASNTGTTVGLGTDTLAPPVGTSSMTVANNTVSASTAANDAQLQIAALTSGSLGNGSLGTRASSDVALSTGSGSTAFLNGVDADYLAANVQTTSGLRASSTVGGTGAGEGVSIRAAASGVTGTTAITGNRVAAETVGNRVGASNSLPALNAGYVQTASYQANTNGNFASDVVNATVAFAASNPSTSVRSTASVANNTILASAQGNVFNGSMALPTAGANYAQSAAQQVNSGTTIAASVRGATVNVAGAGGMASSTLSGNTVGASAMGNVLRATVGAR